MSIICEENGMGRLGLIRKKTVEERMEEILSPVGTEQVWYSGLLYRGAESPTLRKSVEQFFDKYLRIGDLEYAPHGTSTVFKAPYTHPNIAAYMPSPVHGVFQGVIEVASNERIMAVKYMTNRHPGSDLTRNGIIQEIKELRTAIPALRSAKGLDNDNLNIILHGIVTHRGA